MDYLGCTDECKKDEKSCNRESCRYWINFSEDLNCTLIASEKNGPMTLEEVSKRMNLTTVRVKQIQDEALIKMKKHMLPILHE